MKVHNQNTQHIQQNQNQTNISKKTHCPTTANSISNVSNTSNSQPKIITTVKTVHKKEVEQLKQDIMKDVNRITSQLQKDKGGIFGLDQSALSKISTELSDLKGKVKEYQDKITTSTYNHNSSKMANLNKLQNSIDNQRDIVAEKQKNRNNRDNNNFSSKSTFEENIQNRQRKIIDYKNEGHA